MTPEIVIDLFREAMYMVIIMVCSLIIPGLLVGLLISLFQAATQINEQTLSFVPRLIIVFLAFIILGPWLLKLMIELTTKIFLDVPLLIG